MSHFRHRLPRSRQQAGHSLWGIACKPCSVEYVSLENVLVFFLNFLLEYSYSAVLASAIQYNRESQLYMYMYLLSFFGFPSYLGHHRALGRVPCVIK